MSFVAGNASSTPVDRADFWSRHGGAIAWGFVALGVTVRLVRYLLRFPLWGDEMMLAENLLTRDYVGLTQGLDHWQVAPVGYLWAQKAVVDALGFNEFSLRAVALAAGVAGVIVFRIAAGHVLRGLPLVLAVAFLSVAYYPIRHAAEVKPYAVDLLAGVLLLEPLLAWLRDPARAAPLWRLVPAAIFAASCSFPAAFIGGGVSLALAYEAWRRKVKAVLAPWLVYNAALVGTFALIFFAVMRNHYAAHGATMTNYWENGFPPSLTEPLSWPAWLVVAHTGETLAYPLGGSGGGSTLPLLLAIVGGAVLWRTDRRSIVVAVAAAAGLALFAAVLHRYPYGHGERLQQYWAPLLCLLIGQGAAAALLAVRSDFVRRHAVRGVLIACTLIGGGILIRDCTRPYKIKHDADHREFSRRFWSEAATGEPLVDLEEDLQTPVFDSFDAISYRMYKHIYDRRPTPGVESLPAGMPIRCVSFSRERPTPGFALVDERLRRVSAACRYLLWRLKMNAEYRLVDVEEYPVKIEVAGESAKYHVWHFEPRSPESQLRMAQGSTGVRNR